jgi:beta-galactosidase
VQPQGAGFGHFALCFDLYRALRSLGLSIDILPADTAALDGYALVLVPGLLTLPAALRTAITAAEGLVLTGPRTDLKTAEFGVPDPMGPGLPGLRATSVMEETFPEPRPLRGGGAVRLWLEHLETEAEVLEETEEGVPVLIRRERRAHLAGWPDREAARRILGDLACDAGLETLELPDGVRVRDTGTERFVFNYAADPRRFGPHHLPPAGVLRLMRPG